MASAKDLRKRISTVKNTQQTTRAMKMVSAAKLRRSQEAIINQRPYAREIGNLIRLVSSMPDIPFESPLIRKQRANEEGRKKKVLLVLVTSDRGLCGGFNSNVMKAGVRWVHSNQSSCSEIHLAFVGRKGHDYFKHKNYTLGGYFAELGGKVTFLKAKKLSDLLIEKYLNEDFDEVKLIYNEFKNAISQRIQIENYLPLQESSIEDGGLKEVKTGTVLEATSAPYMIKPSPFEVLDQLLKKHFSIQTFRVLLESQAGEHGARMSAMENATRNAGEMIQKLTLQYNKSRQAGITKELLEIIAGSESQKA